MAIINRNSKIRNYKRILNKCTLTKNYFGYNLRQKPMPNINS